MDWPTVSGIIAILGCAIGVAGWLAGRDKRASTDAEWRGRVDAKLDGIMASVSGLKIDVQSLSQQVAKHSERLAKVEASAAQAHKRIDTLLDKDT